MRVRSLLSVVAFLAVLAGWAGAATACEKHLDGHQQSSQTQGEVSGR
jgi:hypothetical protein